MQKEKPGLEVPVQDAEVIDEKATQIEEAKKHADAMVAELKEALWKQYVEEENVTFGTIFEIAKARHAFETGLRVGMELEQHLSSSLASPPSSG